MPITRNTAEIIPILPQRPFEIVTSDIMGPIKPISNSGNRYILVICDHFTKWIEIYALKSVKSTEVATCLTQYCCRNGIFETLITDQRANYQEKICTELYELLDINKARTAPARPQCDGLSERTNR